MHHLLQTDPASIYLKERFGYALEFPNADNAFELRTYEHNHDFMMLRNYNGGEPLNQSSPLPWTPPPLPTPETSSQSRLSPLATVKVAKPDLGFSGKPYNQYFHNTSVHVVTNSETEANARFILRKVREQMCDNSLVLVGVNGLTSKDQGGTTGNKQIRFFKKQKS